MPLYLHERAAGDAEARDTALAHVQEAATRAGAEIVDAHHGVDTGVLYFVLDASDPAPLENALRTPDLEGGRVLAAVRLIGTPPGEGDGQADPGATHLVEWDLPEGLSMEAYLARKAEKSPLYAQVPETRFLRTYVREDMDKCLCFYAAADEDDVCRAREAVGAPIDRLTRVGKPSS